jgi:hypothetical protein
MAQRGKPTAWAWVSAASRAWLALGLLSLLTVTAPAVASAQSVTQVVQRATPGHAPADTSNSAWAEPSLASPTTLTITNQNRNLVLDQRKDYILECPVGSVRLTWALVVWGGHNVVFQNCHIDVTIPNWAGAFKDQTGTLWIHDVHFGGRHLHGGVQLQEPGATVVMRDVLFDRVYGSYTTDHAECVQTWAGPRRLLVDGLTCPTSYQGLFLLPNQFDSGSAPRMFDLRHVDIDDSRGAYALWLGDVKGGMSAMRLHLQDIYVTPNPARVWRGWWLWPQPPARTWGHVMAGAPPGRHYVHATPGGASGVDEGYSPSPVAHERP